MICIATIGRCLLRRRRPKSNEAVRPFRPWQWPHPQSWREVYAVIVTMLVGFLGLAFLLDWLRQVLGRWP